MLKNKKTGINLLFGNLSKMYTWWNKYHAICTFQIEYSLCVFFRMNKAFSCYLSKEQLILMKQSTKVGYFQIE